MGASRNIETRRCIYAINILKPLCWRGICHRCVIIGKIVTVGDKLALSMLIGNCLQRLSSVSEEEQVKELGYKFSCNVVVEPPKMDRFYMDMRVYSVIPQRVQEAEDDPNALVWRGIYLAFETGGVVGKG